MAQVAARLGGPVFLGEWGAAESPAATAASYVRDEASLLLQMGFSSCYWEYGPDLPQRREFPRAQAVLRGAR